jgi:Mrp family chromosome partitioning ATPase
MVFQVERAGGFSEALQDEIALGAAIRDELSSGISLMPAGAPVKSPTVVLKSGAFKRVIGSLLSMYDWIILDSAPATLFPDVATLGTACSAAILVVEAERTRLEVAEAAKEILENTGTQILGAILNRRRYHIPDFIYRRL